MEYSIREMAELTGISSRTLRYYDSIGLLPPARQNEAGYRFYGKHELELLQQILFYRERGFALETISHILYEEGFDISAALREHLRELRKRQDELTQMIRTVQKTIAEMEGGKPMRDTERFEGFKKRILAENEAAYGKEAREAYGNTAVDAAAGRLLAMGETEYERFERLRHEIQSLLEQAVTAGEAPESETGRQVVRMHQEWLSLSWGHCRADAHRGVAAMYCCDVRFRAHYDRNVEGCAEFLRDAVLFWTSQTGNP